MDIFDAVTRSIPNPTLENLSKAELVKELSTLNPNQSVIIGNIKLPYEKNEKNYNVFILARNGEVSQALRFRRVNGKWLQALKVEKISTEPPKTLIEKIDNEFPRNTKGEIDW